LAAAAAVLAVPGAGGHAAQTSPRGVAVFLDWLHLASSAVWVGGLIGLLVLWRSLPVARRVAGLVVSVPRFSNTAFFSVLLLLAAAVLSSLAPPPPAFAKEGAALAHVGPGPVTRSVTRNGYTLRVLVQPNKAVADNAFALQVTRGGKPVRGASVTLDFSMLDM